MPIYLQAMAQQSSTPKVKLQGDDRLVFGDQVQLADATQFRRLVHRAQREGERGFTFEFGKTTYASPLAMAQLVVQTEGCRRAGMHFDVIPPTDKKLRRIFQHSNWAHHLSPVNYAPVDRIPEGWLPVARYRTSDELVQLVNHTCEVMLREANVERRALHGLEWALNEIADNVFQHAEAPDGGLLAVTVAGRRRRVQFVVADSGRGIPASIRTGHAGLDTDVKALRHAIRQGVTRDRRIGAGNGLAGALRIATAAKGRFSLFSGRGLLLADVKHPKPISRSWSADSALDGTVAHFEMAVDRDFELERALLEDGITITDWDFLDATYDPDDRDIRLMVADEVSTTGTRIAATPLRRKVINLVRAHATAKIVLDFAGIERVTASFADEVIGKPLVSLGRLRFQERVVIKGTDDALVLGQIKRALTQRSEEAGKRRREKLAARKPRNRRRRG
jgi:anti-sigma regulatory factor (Ser/Thr protein kinase)